MESRSYDAWIGHDVYDSEGDKIGEITDLYYDDITGRPEWLEVKTGMVGGKRFVPIQGATRYSGGDDEHDDDLQVDYSEDFIKDAPKISSDGDHLTPDEEQDLWSYYGYDYTTKTKTSGYGYGKDYGKLRPDLDYSGARFNRDRRAWEDEQGEVIAEATATNEQVTKTQQPETVRLRKYRWTENVPVQHEEVRVEGDTKTRRDVR